MTNARLIVQSADKSGAEHEITNTISVGSAADNQVRLRDQGIAPYHAIIVRVNDSYLISDIGNSGALVNGARIRTNHHLRDGDVISIGKATRIKFLMPPPQTKSESFASSPSAPNSGASWTASGVSSSGASWGALSSGRAGVGGKSSETYSWLSVALSFMVGLLIVGIVALGYFLFRPDESEVKGKNQPPPVVNPANGTGPNRDPNAVEPDNPEIDPVFIREKAEALTGLLSGASGGDFVFENEFIDRIRNQTREYRTDFYSAAEQRKFEINTTFRNDAGLSELFGYILALSRSRFVAGGSVNGCGVDSDGVGLWRLPQRILRQYPNKCADSNQEVCIAANHFSELLNIFDGPEGFMYAVACFGELNDRAGRILDRLPDANLRRNFWASARAGSMTQDEVSRVVCFMAAGIVAQNPKPFGIDSQSLSSRIK
jgi:FHA domain-containing protein